MRQEGIAGDEMRFAATLDMRYEGQAYELNIPFDERAAEAFHESHERAYGHAIRWRYRRDCEFARRRDWRDRKARIRGGGVCIQHEAEAISEKPSPSGGAIKLYERDALRPGAAFNGEALVFQMDSTTYVPPDWKARVDGFRNLLLERA